MLSHRVAAAIEVLFSATPRPCLLLVSAELTVLQAQAERLQARCPRLQVGALLSTALLHVAPRQRPQAARRWWDAQLVSYAPEPVLCTHIDLLFTPELALDPVQLFRQLGRITPLIVCWPGRYQDQVLSYAVPEHAHYRTWRHPEVEILLLA